MKIKEILNKIEKNSSPVIHSITNYVSINDTANVIIAVGGSPIMAEAKEEVKDITRVAKSLYINIGMLTNEKIKAIERSVKTAKQNNIPIILDPVGVSVSEYRRNFALRLIKSNSISVVKGNLAEIKMLIEGTSNSNGLDSMEKEEDRFNICKNFVRKYKLTVVCTGKSDLIIDNKRICRIENGSILLKKITGSGCMLGGVIAVNTSIIDSFFEACVLSSLMVRISAKNAEKQLKEDEGIATFKIKFIDNLSLLDNNQILNESEFSYEEY